MKQHRRIIFALLAVACLLCFAVRLVVTEGGFDWPDNASFLGLRVIRAVIVLVVGIGLSVSGVLLQSLFRNPLASPAILGLTSGAGLGVVIQVWLASFASAGAASTMLASGSPVVAATLGSFAALLIVFALGHRNGVLDPLTLILVGVIVSIMCGALTIFFQQMLTDRGVSAVTRWMMGSVNENASWWLIMVIAAVVATGLTIAHRCADSLDGLMLSDDEALSIGVHVARIRLLCFGCAGVLTATTVVLVGPIGFVGLVCPHMARWLAGPRHNALIIASALCGALVMLLAEVFLALVRLPSGRIPLGVLTAMIGGPVFIILLRRGGMTR